MGVYNVPNTRSCNRYYICFNGQVIQQNCANGLEYDAESGICTLAHLAKCKLEFCNNVSPFGVTMVANPDNCSRYYACSGGTSTQMTCPKGLLFNRAIGSCDLAANVKCSIEVCFLLDFYNAHSCIYCIALLFIITQLESFDEIEPKVACPAKGVVRMGNPSDCKAYNICIEGSRVNYFCTGNLYFDIRSGRCLEKDKARCAK